MVRPIVIEISAEQVGGNTLYLPQYAGYDVQVDRRGTGALADSEFTNLPSGGFQLKKAGDVFVSGDVFTVTPLPKPIASVTPPLVNRGQYPHRIVVTTISASVDDGTGNFTSTPGATLEYACRAEPKSGNGMITGTDGTRINYDWMVYMPLPVADIIPGTEIEVFNGEQSLLRSTVKRFSIGQFNARIWL